MTVTPTSEKLRAAVAEDVNHTGELVRRRDEIRAAQDRPLVATAYKRGVTECDLRRLDCPDDGEPNPAAAGFRLERAAPCGRPEPCDAGDCPSCRASGGRGHPEYLALTNELKKLHLLKSGGYGTGSDPFANFTAVAQASGEPRYLYPILRSIEKLTRCLSLHQQDRKNELEEEFLDVASLSLCAAAMHRDDTE